MENSLKITTEDLGLIMLALGETISVLKNRFKDEPGSVHPAKKYELLLNNITEWEEPLPATHSFSILAEKVNS